MSIKAKAESQLNWVEKILHFIPGFKGYYQRELRRDSDKVEREYLARNLQQYCQKLNSVSDKILKMKNFDLLTQLNSVVTRITTLSSQIQYAERGYSGFFDLIKIRQAELDQIYQYDLKMLEITESLASQINNFVNEISAANLQTIEDSLIYFGDYFNQRLNLLRGLNKE